MTTDHSNAREVAKQGVYPAIGQLRLPYVEKARFSGPSA